MRELIYFWQELEVAVLVKGVQIVWELKMYIFTHDSHLVFVKDQNIMIRIVYISLAWSYSHPIHVWKLQVLVSSLRILKPKAVYCCWKMTFYCPLKKCPAKKAIYLQIILFLFWSLSMYVAVGRQNKSFKERTVEKCTISIPWYTSAAISVTTTFKS